MLAMLRACLRPAEGVCGAVVLVALVAIASAPARGSPQHDDTILFQRLSVDLRGKRLSAPELAELRKDLSRRDREAVYTAYVDRWVDVAAIDRIFGDIHLGAVAPDRLFLSLARARDPADGSWVYYLPSTVGPVGTAGLPCKHTAKVRPWWSRDAVRVCDESYRPDKVFDQVGYCAGQPDPAFPPLPPRGGCGCGPFLAACLPVGDEFAPLATKLFTTIVDEVKKPALEILMKGSYDELLTTSKSWQSGVVEFLYLRRDLNGQLSRKVPLAVIEREVGARLDQIDLDSPGRWVERAAPYQHSGLFSSTILASALQSNYRTTIHNLFDEFLCTHFTSVHVTSEALLGAVGKHDPNLRFVSVSQSPMRTQIGCKGCHGPMDNAGGFLEGLQTTLNGVFPTGLVGRGKLYVQGPDDYRGEGQGMSGLSELVVRQPEFPRCAVAQTVEALVGRRPTLAEERSITQLLAEFEKQGRSYPSMVRSILHDPVYLGAAPR
jgi:hypothetical protein